MNIESLRRIGRNLGQAAWCMGVLAVGGLMCIAFLISHYQNPNQFFFFLGSMGFAMAAVSFAVLGLSLIDAWLTYCELGRQADEASKNT